MDWLHDFHTAMQGQPAGPLVLTVATVDGGKPRARSVICRDVGEDGRLWFTTDLRSHKVHELQSVSLAECVYWAAATREQFRFHGSMEIQADDTSDRLRLWKGLSDTARAMFFWPGPDAAREPDASKFAISISAEIPPPTTFALLVLKPLEVDHVQLSTHPHRHRRWSARDQWEVSELNP